MFFLEMGVSFFFVLGYLVLPEILKVGRQPASQLGRGVRDERVRGDVPACLTACLPAGACCDCCCQVNRLPVYWAWLVLAPLLFVKVPDQGNRPPSLPPTRSLTRARQAAPPSHPPVTTSTTTWRVMMHACVARG